MIINEYDVYQTRVMQKEINAKINIPSPDYGRNPLFYSIRDDKWVYATIPGAKAPKSIMEPYSSTSDELDKYLKKKLPIYRKKTYWGKEWDIPDIHFDDEGDEFEDDPDYKIK